MKAAFFVLALAGSAFGGLVERHGDGCAADNCARAVTGTRLGPLLMSSHIAMHSRPTYSSNNSYDNVSTLQRNSEAIGTEASAGPRRRKSVFIVCYVRCQSRRLKV